MIFVIPECLCRGSRPLLDSRLKHAGMTVSTKSQFVNLRSIVKGKNVINGRQRNSKFFGNGLRWNSLAKDILNNRSNGDSGAADDRLPALNSRTTHDIRMSCFPFYLHRSPFQNVCLVPVHPIVWTEVYHKQLAAPTAFFAFFAS